MLFQHKKYYRKKHDYIKLSATKCSWYTSKEPKKLLKSHVFHTVE